MISAAIPQTSAALERRIKHHLIGRQQRFFAVTAPGLETICRRELLALPCALQVTGTEKGGVAFEGRLHEVYVANLHCRTAHRFLMRIETFRATNFETLVRKTALMPWELYLQPGCTPEIHVSAHQSRLYHSAAVAERLHQGIQTRMAALPAFESAVAANRPVQRIHARLTQDQCLLSIDSSGANLHKRGLKRQGGQAPLRETLAAAILMRAGYSGREILCDPLCGSGTFALEGALMAQQIPPGWYREFAFQAWPAFRQGRWRHIRRTATPPDMTFPQPMVLASDRSAVAIRRLEQTLAAGGMRDVVQTDQKDFEDLDGKTISQTGGIVVLNPPYGKRLGSRRSAEQTYQAIGRHLRSHFRGWKAAILAPNRRLADLLGFRARRYAMSHGGQSVHVLIGSLPK
jgi:putative N6-adenine-specific DNA methylase